MRRLSSVGLVAPRRGAGTLVKRASEVDGYVQPIDSINELMQYARDTRMELSGIGKVRADRDLAAFLECPVGTRWVAARGLRYDGLHSRPICVTDVYINTAYKGIEDQLRDYYAGIHALIERDYGDRIEVIRQEIAAISVNAADAAALGIQPGEAALRTSRRYYNGSGRLVEGTISIHPGDLFTYSMQLRRRAKT